MIRIFIVFTIVFNFYTSFAGGLIEIKGQVVKIEKGFALIKATSGETKVSMKNLTKKQAKEVQLAQGSSKEVVLQLLPIAIQKED